MSAHHVDVAIIGAGISGIATAHYLSQIPGLSWIILDAADDLGGTWHTFSYPGLRSDSDIDSYCFSFSSWTGSRPLGTGEEILAYLRHTAERFDLTSHMHFGAHVRSANYDSSTQRWKLQYVDAHTGTCHELSAHFLHAAAGYYDHAHSHQPVLPGEENFAGRIVDPQFWPEGLNLSDAAVAIVGSGATAVTLAPALAATARQVTLIQRTVNHTAVMPNTNPLGPARSVLPQRVVDTLDRWRAIGTQALTLKASHFAENTVNRTLSRHRRAIIGDELEATHYQARYPLWSQRVCRVPDGDLFHAIASGEITVLTDSIDHISTQHVHTTGGTAVEADVLIKATGLQLLPLGGITLSVDGARIALEETTAWRGMCLDGVPNFSFTLGYVNDSFTLRAELVGRYLARMITFLRRHGHGAFCPTTPPAGPRRRIIDLHSGYVERGIAQFPSVTDTDPWTLRNDYLREVLDFRRTDPSTDMAFAPAVAIRADAPASTTAAAAPLPEPTMLSTSHGSVRYRHIPAADSLAVVCIHGIGRGLEDFDSLSEQLSASSSEGSALEILSLDIPGFGATPALRGEHSLPQMVQALWEAVDAIVGADRPVVLVGHSLGGALVQRMASAQPSRCAGLVLLAPSGFSRSITPVVTAAAVPVLGRGSMALSHPRVVAAADNAAVHEPSSISARQREVSLRWAQHEDRATTFAAIARALVGTPAAQRMAPARHCARICRTHGIPVGVVWGTEDAVLGIEQLDQLRALHPDAQVTVLPSCGHMVMNEQPAATAQALVALLARINA
ncbi:FAD-containing monooxygenase EthA [Corynebacterium ciconiae DSM 44920]|uniref:alpha/beta fold hydrolase n=1 Tax=Corynebacterium ciconiae TaxID=227319 RepID=UPI00037B3C5C|nr:alpha/beta fold hydrolase [Corynebacterium ciconiae]WKD60106.1 FAD-containing monooxygenase EthA [Corynebacterium ciconiae DSM 44920]